MSVTAVLEAKAREKTTKGAVRSLRQEGQVPAVLYGLDQAPQLFSLDVRHIRKELATPGFFSRLFEVNLNGKTQNALAKDIQFHPVTDTPTHVDFMRVSGSSYVHVAVPIRFINEDKSPGLKIGGVLNIVLHALEISVQAAHIPDELVVDLDGFRLGDVVHLDKLNLPAGSSPLHPERDGTIATIVSPSGLNDKEASEETEAEGA